LVEIGKNVSDEEKLEADARNALLAHYSSKSTNETQILLGLAVAFFAAVQAYSAFVFPSTGVKIAVFTFILGFILFLVFRAIGRLVYWGGLADAIAFVGMLGEVVTQRNLDSINKELDDMKKDKDIKGLEGVDAVSSPTYRLNYASSRYVDCYRMKSKKNRWNVLIRIFRITNDKWFPIYYAVTVFVGYMSLAFAYRLFSYF
jgi:hypothetical protein